MPDQLSHPEPLPPRTAAGARLFTDERLDHIAWLLDECFRLPGTGIRFGLDGIIGLVPGLGDVLAGILSLIIPLAAWIRGVPYITILRMTVNIGIGVLVGSIPLFGDIFDVFWKPNRRNYQLLTRHIGQPRIHTGKDWAFLFILVATIVFIFAIPIILLLVLILWIAGSLSASAGLH